VVEDQEDNRQIVRDLLTANDYEMTEAENREEALAAVAKDRPDLILYGHSAPGHGRLRSNAPHQGGPIPKLDTNYRGHVVCPERR
jgi:CheY-like chemotaxis protein